MYEHFNATRLSPFTVALRCRLMSIRQAVCELLPFRREPIGAPFLEAPPAQRNRFGFPVAPFAAA